MGRSGNRRVQFKEFEVHDEKSAMKVGTDALLLGSWSKVEEASMIADIGCGCGIVALMVAQRAKNALVIGIELEPKAASEAAENIRNSPWSDRVQVVQSSIQEFAKNQELHGRFDVLVSNPPFFKNHPKSPQLERNLARHDDSLPIEVLLSVADQLLKEEGFLDLIWPSDRWDELKAMSESLGFALLTRIGVKGNTDGEIRRFLCRWQKRSPLSAAVGAQMDLNEELVIETNQRINGVPILSEDYMELLDAYVRYWPSAR
ncbi:MAG: methyltransferase [Bacteroidetes bacterium]|nr:methyltransferase [Bacteroidota bacterium]MDA1335918.1 methyltransferase [Bacteroidota bacterium]